VASKDPHQQRCSRLVRRFKGAGIDGLLVTCAENIRYLTGFRGHDSGLLVTPDETILLTDGRYAEQAGQETAKVIILVRKKGLMALAARTARKAGVATLGVEGANLALAQFDALKANLGAVAAKNSAGQVEGLRIIKDRAEIAAIERAIAVAQEAFIATAREIAPGMTERQIGMRLDRTMGELGAEGPAFPTIVAAAERTSLPHAVPTNRKIRKGDAILIDWGARVDGYHSDLTRLAFLDTIPKLFERLYRVVLEAQRRAMAQLRPGRRAGKADATARAWFKAHRHNKFFTHGLGHGLGLMVHEAPALGAKGKLLLKPGMVCTVEPGLYLPGRGGVRIEDDVLITRTGRRILSSLPKSVDSFLVGSS